MTDTPLSRAMSSKTVRVVDRHGFTHRVSLDDWNNPSKKLLPFYTRSGEKWTHTRTGLRAASRGEPFGILRENVREVLQ